MISKIKCNDCLIFKKDEKPIIQIGTKKVRPLPTSAPTKAEYTAIAPFIFASLRQITIERVAKWKSPYFAVPFPIHYFSRSQRKLFFRIKYKDVMRGIRFSASKKNRLFLQDVYWAYLHSEEILRKTRGLARFSDLRLSTYRNGKWKGIRKFSSLKGAKDIMESAEKLSLCLRQLVLDQLPGGKKNSFYFQLQDLFGLDGLPLQEIALAQEAEKISTPQKRLQNIQLKITTGLDAKKDYIVFEVLPI